VPSCSQLALFGQSWPLDTLSGLGWFVFEPAVIGCTAFMPNQRFIVVTEAEIGTVYWSGWSERSVYYIWGGERTVAQPYPSPILYLMHLFWLYPAPLLPQCCESECIVCCVERLVHIFWLSRNRSFCVCVCVCVYVYVCANVCMAQRGGLSRVRWRVWQLYSGGGN